ncbi:MAG: hypothetical protein JSU96_14575, partial [Acidobacteriota bacterium]
MSSASESRLVQRLDAMYEFDREPVSKSKLQGIGNFLGIYASEHVAGTEFVIGPLFVVHGVTASDLIWGLIVGNLLAVLSWTAFCTPIAVRVRLTLYWQLRKICGPYLTYLYSIVSAVMLCFLAGAMISVAATAVGLPFNIPMPELSDRYPSSLSWVIVVFAVGGVVTTLAILGFERISRFGKVCAPWMFLVFVAAGLAVLPQLGMQGFGDFWRVANEKIWTGTVVAGQTKFTFWHVMFFAWFCNLAFHIGMADLTIFRYAKKWQYGFASGAGMYLGHFVAWISSGILCAAAAGSVTPGPIAYMGAGIAGAVCVVIAGWTTANPTLYRAGLAIQVAT